MSNVLAKYIAKRVLGETAKNRFGKDDPYFERVPASDLDGRPSKKNKKQRKAIPPGISEHDAKILNKVKRRAHILDYGLFNFCGIKFGWSSAVGLVPGIGDVLDGFMAAMVISTCCKIDGGLPAYLKMRMLINLIIDVFIGLTPFLGDLADALFRCNSMNAVLLEKHLAEKGRQNLAAQPMAAVTGASSRRPSDPMLLQNGGGEWAEDALGPPPRYQAEITSPAPERPPAAKVAHNSRSGGGWLGGLGWGRREPKHDIERGEGAPPRSARP
ncbi:MAG: hypothetical protein M1838_000140 [Thelocarpon superellum]|nr:MAG: hypothetical protein M1838_000140 [Thelocarpon superellum]